MPLVITIALGVLLALVLLPLLGPIAMIAIGVAVVGFLIYGVIAGGTLLKMGVDKVNDPEFQKKAAETAEATKKFAKKTSENQKVRKVAVVVAAVLVVAVGGYAAWNTHTERQWMARHVSEWIVEGKDYYYDSEEELLAEYNKIKNKGYFSEQVIEDLEAFSILNHSVAPIISRMDQLGYENEAVKAYLTGVYQTYRQGTDTEDLSSQLSRLQIIMEDLEELNSSGTVYYRLDFSDIYPEDELDSFLTEEIAAAKKAKNTEDLIKLLFTAGLVTDKTYMKETELLGMFVSADSEVVTLLNGIGGYYDIKTGGEEESDDVVEEQKDGAAAEEPKDETATAEEEKVTYTSGGVHCYGDFHYTPSSSYTTKGKYDTSGLNAGIWNALSPGLRDEIKSGSSKTHYVPAVQKFRDTEIEEKDVDFSEIIGQGYDFAYLIGENSFIFVSEDSVLFLSPEMRHLTNYPIKGDFAKVLQDMEKTYTEAKGTVVDEAERERNSRRKKQSEVNLVKGTTMTDEEYGQAVAEMAQAE